MKKRIRNQKKSQTSISLSEEARQLAQQLAELNFRNLSQQVAALIISEATRLGLKNAA